MTRLARHFGALMDRFTMAPATGSREQISGVESPRKFSSAQYAQCLHDASSFLQDWWSRSDPVTRAYYQPWVEAVSLAQKTGRLLASESPMMNLANRLGAGATMQTSKLGPPQKRVVRVNRDFLDEMMMCGAAPAEVAAGLLHEAGHVIQGWSRFGPFPEWGPSKIYDPSRGNHSVRESLERFFQELPQQEQSWYTRFGPWASGVHWAGETP